MIQVKRAYSIVFPLLAVLLALPVVAQCAATPAVIGPYVQNVGKDSATICWATVVGATNYAGPDAAFPAQRVYEHRAVTLRDLKPGTTYNYDVLGDGTDLGKGCFTTVPDRDQPFSFCVIGDTQGNQEVHRRLVERMIGEKPDMIFNTGDLTSEGLDISYWERFFAVNASLMRSIPYYPALGNHELDTPYYFEFFSLPGNQRYYSFDRGSAHFVVLDSVGPMMRDTHQTITPEQAARFAAQREEYWQRQLTWLKEDLAYRSGARYVFVFFHYPLYTLQTQPGYVTGAQDMRRRFGTILQDFKVSAVFNGHDHQYHRAVAGGVPFIVGGMGAGSPRPLGPRLPETVVAAQRSGFTRVRVDGDKAVVRAADVEGNLVDEFTILPRTAAN